MKRAVTTTCVDEYAAPGIVRVYVPFSFVVVPMSELTNEDVRADDRRILWRW